MDISGYYGDEDKTPGFKDNFNNRSCHLFNTCLVTDSDLSPPDFADKNQVETVLAQVPELVSISWALELELARPRYDEL